MIVAVTCGTSIDRTVVLDRLVPGEVHRPTEIVVTAGGKGLNVARAVHTLAGEVVAVAIVGGHSGRWVHERLIDEGIAHRLIDGEAETRICMSLADLSTGTMTDIYEPASPVSSSEWEQLGAAALAISSPGDWVAIAGRPPIELPERALRSLIDRCHGAGLKVALDTSGPALAEGLAAGVELVKVNRAEAGELFGDVTPGELAARLAERGALSVVTAGTLGAFGMGRHVSSLVRGAFPVGSGDCFLGGMLVSLDRGEDPVDSLALAMGAAVANSERPGAACFDRARAEQLAGLINT